MKRIIVTMFVILLVSMGGCYNLVEINDAAIAQNFSLDLLPNGELAFYAQTTEPVPRAETGEAQPLRNITLMGTGNTAAEAARNIFLHFPRVLLWIHSNTMFIGEDLAREDLAFMTDFYIRNRNVRLQAYVFMARDAKIQELLEVMNNSAFGSNSARSIVRQIEIQEKDLGYYVPLQALQLLEYLVTPGIEPAIPQVVINKEGGQERIRLQGMAVIKQNRVIGSLDETESRGYHYLQARKKMGGLVVIDSPTPESASVTMEITNCTTKTRPVIQADQLSMRIAIECELQYLEEVGTSRLYSPEHKRSLEDMASRQIEQQVQACINKAQALNSDILGWGLTTARYQPDLWARISSDWDERFPDIQNTIEVKATLLKDGLSQTSFEFQ
ncbi:spore germination protein gerkc [hydrocarbon metagenome]|uniref:Spore germination protein gerkc n=1 Tax=hydrocarbon metagenome TaxID=938273 RepID=A0A0W8E7J2_9ZZZZ